MGFNSSLKVNPGAKGLTIKVTPLNVRLLSLNNRSWIAEILQGLSNQYTELTARNNSGTVMAGFINVTGSKIVDMFHKNIGSTKRILYKFQIVGPLDHVWLVEQLPYGGGYRVYQSYNNAYSLKVMTLNLLTHYGYLTFLYSLNAMKFYLIILTFVLDTP